MIKNNNQVFPHFTTVEAKPEEGQKNPFYFGYGGCWDLSKEKHVLFDASRATALGEISKQRKSF